LDIPAGVEVRIDAGQVFVKGPKGELSMMLHPRVTATLVDKVVTVTVQDQELVDDRAKWGLTRRLIENMVLGVTKGFSKQLEINGVGYKVAMQGKDLKLDVGFSHDVVYVIPAGITAAVEKNVITISGISKHLVGETAAQIRKIKKPEPYKGKGIKYVDEVIQRKAGKAAKAAA
jgi:large subunit ribosomal protein L6